MYKIIPLPNKIKYSEVEQSNSLRWTILHKEEEKVFRAQTGVIRCKDFFNDVVAAYNNCIFIMYGFDNEKLTLSEDGVWVLLSELQHKDNLIHNIGSINKEAESKGLPPLSGINNESMPQECLLFIPRAYFANTYLTSLVTYLIRIAHSPVKVESFEELVSDSNPTGPIKDCPFSGVKAKVFKYGLQVPFPSLKERWAFMAKTESDNKKYLEGGTKNYVHNNGVSSWWNLAEANNVKVMA